jgi:hypothetical protein
LSTINAEDAEDAEFRFSWVLPDDQRRTRRRRGIQFFLGSCRRTTLKTLNARNSGFLGFFRTNNAERAEDAESSFSWVLVDEQR